jgi:hypothetical protein
MGITCDSFEAMARANFDVRGHLMPDASPAGFQNVTIEMRIESDASEDRLKDVGRLGLGGCPGVATLRDPVSVKTALTVARRRTERAA